VLQIFPTLLELCDCTHHSIQKSIFSHLKFPKDDFEETLFTFSETGGLQGPFPSPKSPNVFCVKNSKFKLVYYKTPNNFELFDLEKDQKEKNNLYGQSLEIEKILTKKLFDWIDR
jgi:hypothetical protein